LRKAEEFKNRRQGFELNKLESQILKEDKDKEREEEER